MFLNEGKGKAKCKIVYLLSIQLIRVGLQVKNKMLQE